MKNTSKVFLNMQPIIEETRSLTDSNVDIVEPNMSGYVDQQNESNSLFV